jgi:hypothetical protein
MKTWNVVTTWTAGYYGSKCFRVQAETRLAAQRAGLEMLKDYILSEPSLPDWLVRSGNLLARAGEITE